MKHFIITGACHAGKTTYAAKLNEILSQTGISSGGFLCEGTFQNGERNSFFIKSLLTYEKELLADKNESINSETYSFGCFTFYKKGFDFAYKEYKNSILNKKDIIFIDEIGRLELEGGGFEKLFHQMPVNSMLIAVCRYDFIKDINSMFFNNHAEIININDDIYLSARKVKNYL